jgi:hypothetical protein
MSYRCSICSSQVNGGRTTHRLLREVTQTRIVAGEVEKFTSTETAGEIPVCQRCQKALESLKSLGVPSWDALTVVRKKFGPPTVGRRLSQFPGA